MLTIRTTTELAAKGVNFEPLGNVTLEGCELSGAIKLNSIATALGDVKISGEPTMLCSFARQFTGWVRDVGAPLTCAYMGQKLVTIETGPGLVRRTRYNKTGEKVSEHAKGNAIDIASFRLGDKSRILVKQSLSDTQISQDLPSDGLRLLYHDPRARIERGARRAPAFRPWIPRQDEQLSDL